MKTWVFAKEGIPGRTNTEGVRSSSKAGVPGKDEVNQLDGLPLTALQGQNSLQCGYKQKARLWGPTGQETFRWWLVQLWQKNENVCVAERPET